MSLNFDREDKIARKAMSSAQIPSVAYPRRHSIFVEFDRWVKVFDHPPDHTPITVDSYFFDKSAKQVADFFFIVALQNGDEVGR